MVRLTDAAQARLRIAMRPHKITLVGMADALGVGRSTAHRILAGEADVPATFAAFVASIGTTADRIVDGEPGAMPANVVDVPVFDVEVAAGAGRFPLAEERATGVWPFPVEWLGAMFGSAADLALLRVAGDSQEPELRDGDMVLVNRADQRLRDGMTVVRLEDTLLIKRVQLSGATVRLKSANPAYEDIVVDLQRAKRDQSDGFAVIGRAVWAGKLL